MSSATRKRRVSPVERATSVAMSAVFRGRRFNQIEDIVRYEGRRGRDVMWGRRRKARKIRCAGFQGENNLAVSGGRSALGCGSSPSGSEESRNWKLDLSLVQVGSRNPRMLSKYGQAVSRGESGDQTRRKSR
jgi:hypothetical protein